MVKGQRFIPILVIAAGIWAYHNSLTGPFIFDDLPSISDNRTIRHLWPAWYALSPPHGRGTTVEGRPVLNFTLAVNYAFDGVKPWGYHVVNLAIHILAGLTLFGIVRRTLRQPALRERFGAVANDLALATAVLWIVHPLQTESVTYLSQRAESLMGLFYLLTMYCFIRGTASRSAGPWFIFSIVACLLGMATKEVMVSAPLMTLLYDRTFLSGSFREAWRRRRLLYLALGGTWILLGYLVATAGRLRRQRRLRRQGTLVAVRVDPNVRDHALSLAFGVAPSVAVRLRERCGYGRVAGRTLRRDHCVAGHWHGDQLVAMAGRWLCGLLVFCDSGPQFQHSTGSDANCGRTPHVPAAGGGGRAGGNGNS